MSTLWWIVVLWLVACASFTAGWIVRVEIEVWNRMNDWHDANASFVESRRDRLGA